jgi:ATP-dependent Clp protease ATP-binding subunit ClpB
LALLAQQEGIVYPLLDRLGVAPLELRRTLESRLDGQPHVYGDAEISTSPELSRALTEADRQRATQ